MRLYELEQQPKGRPEIFLDMDGVLADFFSEYAKLAGVPADVKSGRADYRNIPAELREPAIDQMRGTDFFYRLPKFPSADRLVAMVVQVFGYYNICSSPLRGDNQNSEAMKRAWIAENLDPQPRVIRITGRKGKYAKQPDGTPNILIDDRNTVLTEWEQSGGIGIKYQADEDGLDVVASGLRRAFEIVKGRREHTPQNIQSKDYGKMIAGPQDNQEEKTMKSSEFIKQDVTEEKRLSSVGQDPYKAYRDEKVKQRMAKGEPESSARRFDTVPGDPGKTFMHPKEKPMVKKKPVSPFQVNEDEGQRLQDWRLAMLGKGAVHFSDSRKDDSINAYDENGKLLGKFKRWQ